MVRVEGWSLVAGRDLLRWSCSSGSLGVFFPGTQLWAHGSYRAIGSAPCPFALSRSAARAREQSFPLHLLARRPLVGHCRLVCCRCFDTHGRASFCLAAAARAAVLLFLLFFCSRPVFTRLRQHSSPWL